MSCEVVCPLLVKRLSTWKPLLDPALVLEEMVTWRNLLPNYFNVLLWQCWLPPVRTALVQWEPREHDKILEFVATWRSEVTQNIWDNLVNQMIIPKVSSAVNNWDPYNETVRIDTWLLPWLPIVGKPKMITVCQYNLQ